MRGSGRRFVQDLAILTRHSWNLNVPRHSANKIKEFRSALQELDWEEEILQKAENHAEANQDAKAFDTLTTLEEVLQLKEGIEELQDNVQIAPLEGKAVAQAEEESEQRSISDESGLKQVHFRG